MRTMRKAPCYQCGRRSVGCHSTCEDYIAFCQGREKLYEERKQAAELAQMDREKELKIIKAKGWSSKRNKD